MPSFNSSKFWAGLTLFSALAWLPSSVSADPLGRPIKNIYACAPSEIVVEFEESSGMPNAPHILDLPGPNHRIVFDFSDASFEDGVIADPETISTSVNHVLPNVKAVHYTNISNGDKPIARLVLDLDQSASVNPRVAELALGQVTVSLANKAAAFSAASASKTLSSLNQSAGITSTTPPMTQAATLSTAQVSSPPAVGFSSAASQTISTDDHSLPTASTDNKAATPTLTAAATAAPATTATSAALPTTTAAPVSTTTAAAPPAAAVVPSDPGQRALDALKHYNMAVKLHLVGKLGDAIIEYQNALTLNPQLGEAHSNLGLVYNQQHNYAQALSEFRKTLSINPRDAITYNGIGAALRAEKDLPGAIKNWETAVELDPHLATASYNLGTAYELQKEYDRAVKAYEQAVKSDYRLGEAYYRIGLIMERQHRYQEAEQQFSRALKVSASAEYSEDVRQRLAYLEQNKKISKR